jgi:hypothetical protein
VDEDTPENNPIIGATIVASIRRFSDDKWWNFSDGTWDTVAFSALTSDHKQALTDKGDGSYEADWDQQAADGGVERQYRVYYEVTSAGNFLNRIAADVLTFTTLGTVVTDIFGNGDFPIALTVEDNNGYPVAAATLTIAGTAAQTTGSMGDFPNAWALYSGTYMGTLRVGANYVATNPYTITVDSSGNVTVPTGGVLVVEAVALPEPAPAGYCAVRCIAETQSPDYPSGVFRVADVISPEKRTESGVEVVVVFGPQSAVLDDGRGTLNILQDAVVTLEMSTSGDAPRRWENVRIPARSNADVADLVEV